MKSVLKTTVKPNEVDRKWFVVDAEGKVLGRLASLVATVLQGKNNPYYTPQWDMGDHVIVLNAKKVVLTGNKEVDKIYYRHTGFPGGIKGDRAKDLREKDATKMIELAVKRMLPKNRLAKEMVKKMHVYDGSEHPYGAQQPTELKIS